MFAVLRRVDGAVAAVERLLVVVAIAAMTALFCVQIGMRFASGGGLAWADELIRFGMMWVALLGASLATRERRHITIDLLDRSLSPRGKAVCNVIVEAVGVAAVGSIAYVAAWYIGQERQYPDASPALGVLYWQMKVIMPVALSIIAARLGLLLIEDLDGLRRSDFAYLSGPDGAGRLY